MLKLPVYMDHNATTPCDPQVVEAMLPYFSQVFGNAASRSHPFGWQAAEAADLAREQVAALIGAEPKEIVFTSGATESNNLALKGVFDMYAGKGKHVITFVTEHKAVLDACRHIERKGATVTYLPVNSDGLPDLRQLENAVTPSTILIAAMYANNETGTVFPIRAISEVARKFNVPLFSDAAQAAGKVPLNVHDDGIDLLSLSGHKMYGPKGVGALYIRRKNPRMRLTAQIDGGGHEGGTRSGTLNVPGIVGLGKACEISLQQMTDEAKRLKALRDRLEKELLDSGDVQVNGSVIQRLPHVTNLSFGGLLGDALMIAINKEIAVSSGSACTSASPEPSHVLRAIGVSDALAHSSLRFSVGRYTTNEEITFVVQKIKKAYHDIRKRQGETTGAGIDAGTAAG